MSIAFVDKAHHDALRARVDGAQPSGGTPTGTALFGSNQGGYGELSTFTPPAPLQAGGKKVLVLITDGCPNGGDVCTTSGKGTDNYTTNQCVSTAATQAKAATPQGPIETFVIGVGPLPGDFKNYDPYFLAYMAQAGGSAPTGCNLKENAAGATDFCYFSIDPSVASQTQLATAFETAINNIRGQVASCTFALNLSTDGGAIDPSKVNVTLNGTTIPQDPINGWTYDNANNPTSVTLHGTSCATVTTTPSSTVSVVLGCVTVVPPPAK